MTTDPQTTIEPDLDRLGRAILREAGMLNNPSIQDDVQKMPSISLMYATRYAAAVVRELRAMELLS